MARLIVKAWHTECSCGYGAGGWATSRNVHGPLTPDSTECPSCGEEFTERLNDYYVPVERDDA